MCAPPVTDDDSHGLAGRLRALLAQGAAAQAWRLLDEHLAETGRHAQLPALRQHMALAPAPRLAITAGLPGAGKSHVALALLQQTGAVRIRSDVERKRLHGLSPLQSSAQVAGGIYGRDSTQRTYARLLELATLALDAGWPVIVDAAFLRADERAAFADLAAQRGLPFALLWCHAPAALLRQRIAARQARAEDASEADIAVLERLLPAVQPPLPQERAHLLELATDAPLDLAALDARWRALSPTG